MNGNFRSYSLEECAVFNKTKEKFGGLSNMCSGFLIKIFDYDIKTSEALYQMCRFPDRPDIQEKIYIQKSPMAAKMVSKPFRNFTRPDWDNVRINIMRWCLRVKLSQNFIKFKKALFETDSLPIVELSRKDSFWGAKLNKVNNRLEGNNILGRLLMELREDIKNNADSHFLYVSPLEIKNFKLFGKPIGVIESIKSEINLEPSKQLKLLSYTI